MKKIPESLDEKLLLYLDEKLSPAERRHLDELLAVDPELKARFDMLANMDTMLRTTGADQPSRNFTQLVMTKLDQYPAAPRKAFTLFNGLLLLAGVVVAITLAALVSNGAFDSTTTSIDLNQVELPQQVIDQSMPTMPSFTLSGKVIMNLIILVNLALGWVMLDRLFLKPYFQRRMHTSH